MKIQLYYVIVTNGDKGCSSPICSNWTSEQIAATRQQEAFSAAKVLGVSPSNVELLDYEDCLASFSEQAILEDLLQIIRSWKPDVLMSWYPYPRLDLRPSENWGDLGFHPDHQAVGRFVLTAKFEAGVKRAYPHLGPSHSVSEFYVWEFAQPTHYVDISKSLDMKITAWAEHKTQYNSLGDVESFLTVVSLNVAGALSNKSITRAEGFIAYF